MGVEVAAASSEGRRSLSGLVVNRHTLLRLLSSAHKLLAHMSARRRRRRLLRRRGLPSSPLSLQLAPSLSAVCHLVICFLPALVKTAEQLQQRAERKRGAQAAELHSQAVVRPRGWGRLVVGRSRRHLTVI